MEDIKELKDMGLEYKEALVGFCRRLIQTKSLSSQEGNIACLYLDEMGKLGYDRVFRDEAGNVIGIVEGTEPGPTIMYNSHMDHVKAGDRNNWEGYDPYGGEVDICEVENQHKTGKETVECIHGRGASDVKGGAAAQIYAGGLLVKLKKEGLSFPGKFMFTGVVEEEPAASVGMNYLCDVTLPKEGLSYEAMVSSEATSLNLYLGHRGKAEFLVTVFGRTSHASAPWLGINAIQKAVVFLDRFKKEFEMEIKQDEDLGCGSAAPTVISCSPGALAIIPDRCFITIDRRMVPSESIAYSINQIQMLIDRLSKEDPEFKADVKMNCVPETTYTGIKADGKRVLEGWKIPKTHPVVTAAKQALETIGQNASYGYWDFATDAGKTAGVDKKPCIGYSPMQEQYAHTPYDKVRTDYMVKAIEGNAAIFLELSKRKKEDFLLLNM